MNDDVLHVVHELFPGREATIVELTEYLPNSTPVRMNWLRVTIRRVPHGCRHGGYHASPLPLLHHATLTGSYLRRGPRSLSCDTLDATMAYVAKEMSGVFQYAIPVRMRGTSLISIAELYSSYEPRVKSQTKGRVLLAKEAQIVNMFIRFDDYKQTLNRKHRNAASDWRIPPGLEHLIEWDAESQQWKETEAIPPIPPWRHSRSRRLELQQRHEGQSFKKIRRRGTVFQEEEQRRAFDEDLQ